MGISRLSSRLAATTAISVIAAGALVGGSATSANAVDVIPGGSATYTCDIAALGLSYDVPVELPVLPTNIPTEMPLTGLAVPVNITSPASLLGLLSGQLGATQLGGGVPDFSFLVGDLPVSVDDLTAPLTALPAPGTDLILNAAGTLGSFTAPAPGTYKVAMPSSFTMNPTSDLVAPLPSLPCTIKDPSTAEIGQVSVRKQTSALAAVAAKKTIKKGTAAKVATRVTRELGGKGAGTVKVVENGRKLTSKSLNDGAAKFSIKNLKVGKHVLKFVYLGNARTATASKNVTIKVVK
jgi:hypothetical protein